MIRILHIVSSLGTGSGVLSVLMSYHRAIDRSKVQFDYLSFKQTDTTFEEEILSLGGRVYHCSKPSFAPSFQKRLDRFFAEHEGEYTIVHCHPIYASALFGGKALKHGVRHVIQHSHTTQFSDKKWSGVRNKLVLSLFRNRATDFAACSEDAKAIFSFRKPETVYLMPNAIDTGKFRFDPERRRAVREELGVSGDEILLGHVGRFSPEKNHKFLLKVLKSALKQKENTKLLLLGDGPLMEEIRALATHLGDRVIFAGRHSNVSDYMSAMDCLVFPSEFEGLGIVLIEAQSCALPAAASDRVPKEANVTGAVRYLPLEESPERWAKAALDAAGEGRLTTSEMVSGSVFSIEKAALALAQYYRELG